MFSSYAFAPLSLIVPLSAVSVIGKEEGDDCLRALHCDTAGDCINMYIILFPFLFFPYS